MLSVVILAAGKGMRMQSNLPKVLHPLLGSPLLEYPMELAEQLTAVYDGGCEGPRIAVVVGHGRELIKEAYADRDVLWAIQEEQLGTGHAARTGVAVLLKALGAGADEGGKDPSGEMDLLILNGDLPLLRRETLDGLVDRHQKTRAEVTLLTSVKEDPSGFGRIVRERGGSSGEDGKFSAIVEELDADPETLSIPEVNVGIYMFRASAFLDCYDRIGKQNSQGEYYLPDVVVQAAKDGRHVDTVRAGDDRETVQVNSRQEMARASEILRERFLLHYMDAGVTIDDPGTTYIEGGVTIGKDTRIHPFTVIRKGVRLGPGCEVGPFTQLRPGTDLQEGVKVGNFVEIKNSTLGKGTKASHLAYVGDGEVGRNVNLGAGTIFANYDGKTKSTTVVKDGAFIGSGSVLVAPVSIGKGATTGAGSVVLKNRNVADGEVVVGVPACPVKERPPEETKPRKRAHDSTGKPGTGKAPSRK